MTRDEKIELATKEHLNALGLHEDHPFAEKLETFVRQEAYGFIDDDTATVDLTEPQRDVIIAALRLWQKQDELDPELVQIAENGRGHGGFPTDVEIDDLIENVLNG